ncbi:hypothetical protein [Limnofasciculus baicalensis]|uniref:hypothetical protein n=1 Tax=Limnofasciculus baicalensis TaxID=3064906 RepID=UPI0020A7E724|nr:hypothetical protein [Limnofasciculus baicalensis]
MPQYPGCPCYCSDNSDRDRYCRRIGESGGWARVMDTDGIGINFILGDRRSKIPIEPVTESPLNLAIRLPATSSIQTV